ncbi:hypothetical protein BC834DRAFT_965676 [Gloeopeniophorella convolvens]|nr:hypothetical protein BC834DRAFT_965676 [Gloeopeniophorella convolvens]
MNSSTSPTLQTPPDSDQSQALSITSGALQGLLGPLKQLGIKPAQWYAFAFGYDVGATLKEHTYSPTNGSYAGYLLSTVLVGCTQSALLSLWMRQSFEDVISVSLITFLLGGLILSVWFNFRAMHRALGDMSTKLNETHGAVKSIEHAINDFVSKATETTEAKVPEMVEPEVPETVASDVKAGVPAVDVQGVEEEVPETTAIAVPTVPEDRPEAETQISQSGEEAAPTQPSELVEGLEYIDTPVFLPEVPAEQVVSAAEVPVERAILPAEPTTSRWTPGLAEMKQQVAQFAGRFLTRVSGPTHDAYDRRPILGIEKPHVAALRRAEVSLLMHCAELPTADFASPEGYFTSASTIYCPTGDPKDDGNIAFSTAMDCFDTLEFPGSMQDQMEFSAKVCDLAQALSDLGFHEFALIVSEPALALHQGNLSQGFDAFRVEFASLLSLRAGILGEVKKLDEAIESASESVRLLKEHEEPHGPFTPELAYARLRHGILLDSAGQVLEAAGVIFELIDSLGGVVDTRWDMKPLLALAQLCLAHVLRRTDIDAALPAVDEAIELSRTALGTDSRGILGTALLVKAQLMSSQAQDDLAHVFSDEAITHLRSVSDTKRPTFSLILAHALTTHSHLLKKGKHAPESYSAAKDAAELYQELHTSAPRPLARPLAYALFHLSKYRSGDKRRDLGDLRFAESAVALFRSLEPMDIPGLADALYLYADRMLEVDKNREAATYAEESVLHFRTARDEDPERWSLDLIFSLSLASSCLACTERAEAALEYAKQAVDVQRWRASDGDDKNYKPHLKQLLISVVMRLQELDRPDEDALPWMVELQGVDANSVEGSDVPVIRRSGGKPGGKDNQFRKETSVWMDPSTIPQGAAQSKQNVPVVPSPSPPPPETNDRYLAPRADKGKGRATPSTLSRPNSANSAASRAPDEEIYSPGTTGQRRLPGSALWTSHPREARSPGTLPGSMAPAWAAVSAWEAAPVRLAP